MKRIVLNFVFISLTLHFSIAVGQSEKALDSLLRLVKTNTQDTTQVKRLNAIGRNYSTIGEYSLAIEYANSALQLAQKLAVSSGSDNIKMALQKTKIYTFGTIGMVYFYQADYENAFQNYLKALKEAELAKDTLSIASVCNNIGLAFRNQSDYTKALDYYLRSLKMSEACKDKRSMCIAFVNIGSIYEQQCLFPKTLDQFYKALRLAEELNNKDLISHCYLGLGNFFLMRENYPKAHEFYFKAEKLLTSSDEKILIANVDNNIGLIYYYQGNFPKALEFYAKAIKLRAEFGDKYGLATSYSNFGMLLTEHYKLDSLKKGLQFVIDKRLVNYTYEGLSDSAIVMEKRALAISEELSDELGMCNGLSALGTTFLAKKKLEPAISYFEKAYELGKKIGAVEEQMDAALNLYAVFKETKDATKALYWYETYREHQDTVFSKEANKKSIQTEMNFEFEKKEQAAKLEQEKKEALHQAELEKEQMQRYWLYGGLLVIMLFSSVLFSRFRTIRKQKKIIEEQKALVEEKQKEVLDSIHYAQRIQKSLLPTEKYIAKTIRKSNKVNEI